MQISFKHIICSCLFVGFLLFGCKKKPDPDPVDPTPEPTQGTLKINFVPKFGTSSFAFYTDFNNPLNQRIQFEMLKFFATNFYAITTSGDTVYVKDAFKYDLAAGKTLLSVNLDPNDFTGMYFSFGVDTPTNHQDPTLLDPSHPLSYNQANTMHWGWASGYVFMKCEAKADTSGTGTGSLSQFVTFHIGYDTCYQKTPFLPKTFSISIGSTTTLNLDMDIAKFITTATDTIDLRIDNVTHSNDYPILAQKIAFNVAQSFSFE